MTEIGNFIVAHWETLLGVLLLLLATDGIAGYLPDKWVPYVGALKRVAQILLTRFGKGVPIILAMLMLGGCAGLKSNLEETGAPMAIPPPLPGTAAELTTGTETKTRVWSPSILATQFGGAAVEVVDEAVTAATGNGDAAHGYSQNAIIDYLMATIDADGDGSVTDETWYLVSGVDVPHTATVLIGGGAGALDAIPVAGLAEGHVAVVTTISGADVVFYIYKYDETAAALTESSPTTILPDDGDGTDGWRLMGATNQNLLNTANVTFATGNFTGANGLTVGTGSANTGAIQMKNATNNNIFTITSGVAGAAIGWTTPTAAPDGANYLLNVDADGTMGYTDPATLGGATAFDDIGDPDAATSISFGNNEGVTLATAEDTGSFLLIDNSVADLTGDTYLIDLQYADSDDANGFYLRCLDDSGGSPNTVFTIGQKGNVSSDGTIAGNEISATAQLKLPSSDAGPTATAGYIRHDSTVAGLETGALAWYDGDEVRYIVDLDVLPSDDTYVVAYNATDDKFYMKADATGAGGSGSVTTVKEADSQVGGADIVILDFGAGFDVAESPDTEVQITFDPSEITSWGLTANVSLDDGTGDSPTLTFQDATNETAVFNKIDSGFLTITTPAADGVAILTGNLKVGGGSPGQAQDGQDGYVTGTLEVDGMIHADGGVTGNVTGTASVAATGDSATSFFSSGTIEAARLPFDAPGAIGGTTPAAITGTTITGTSFVTTKTSGAASDIGLYEANSTDTHAAGFRGPASITGDGAYRGQLPNARASSANMVLAWTNAAESGTGTAADPYIQAVSFVDLDNYALIESINTAAELESVASLGAFASDLLGYANAAAVLSGIGAQAALTNPLVQADIDDTPSDANTTQPASSNSVADHIALTGTAHGLSSSVYGQKEIGWTIKDSDVDTAVADGKQAAAIPASMNGMNLVDVTCSVSGVTGASSGATTIVLRRVRAATAVDMTSTGVTIDYNAYTASDETVDTSNDDVATGDKIFVDVNGVSAGAAAKGLYCTAVFQTP